MHLKTRNVNSAFRELVELFHRGEGCKAEVVSRSSRYGDTLTIDEPVIITYTRPLERVLFNAARDVNPFALLYESLWMLAGRNDVAPLVYYTKRFAEFSDDGMTLNDAYGYRWREDYIHLSPTVLPEETESNPDDYIGGFEEVDQIQLTIQHLKAKPDSRRAVLQMWNIRDDLMKVGTSKGVCCNLSVLFSLRDVVVLHPNKMSSQALEAGATEEVTHKCLDMTVFNRSNDLVWGALGANMVTFSVLMEYVAAHLNVRVGWYNQVSNNLHVYKNNWKPDEWLADETPDYYSGPIDPLPFTMVPLVEKPDRFDETLPSFVERHSKDAVAGHYFETFFDKVAEPMFIAYHHYKRKEYARALASVCNIKSDDWRIACAAWLTRRASKGAKI